MKKIEVYVKEALKKGYSSDQIESKLIESGYPVKTAKSLVNKYIKKPISFKHLIFILAPIVLIIIISALLFKQTEIESNTQTDEIISPGLYLIDKDRYVVVYPESCLVEESLNRINCLSEENNVNLSEYSFCGLYVGKHVYENMNLDSGMIVGDIITAANELKMNEELDFWDFLSTKQPGDKVMLTIKDKGDIEIEIYKSLSSQKNTIGYSLSSLLCKE